MSWKALDTTWQDMCAGRLCCLCQVEMPAPKQRGFRYCIGCVPTPADTPHLVHFAIDHHNEGWSVTMHSAEEPIFTLWMIAVTDEQLERIVDRARISTFDREAYPRAIAAWGRYSFYAHMTQAQLRNLHRAWQTDPRNGYEKRNNLPAGASSRMRV